MQLQKPIRQGDVILTPVASIPAGAVQIPNKEKGRVVLAYGEVTGHAHAIYENTDHLKVWAIGKVKYLEVMAGAMVDRTITSVIVGLDGEPMQIANSQFEGVCLKHEEHTHHVLPPGVYKLPVQVEYTPQALQITRD